MNGTVLAHPRTVVAGSLILTPGVGRALGDFLATLGKRDLIAALGECMTEKSLRVRAAPGPRDL